MITSYENLFSQIDKLLEEVSSIRSILLKREKLPKEVPKNMSIEQAIEYMTSQGFVLSKSKIYKLCASKKIPHTHFGNRLVFNSKEIILWCDNQITKNNYKIKNPRI